MIPEEKVELILADEKSFGRKVAASRLLDYERAAFKRGAKAQREADVEWWREWREFGWVEVDVDEYAEEPLVKFEEEEDGEES